MVGWYVPFCFDSVGINKYIFFFWETATGREKDPVKGYVRGSIFGNELREVTLEAHFDVPEGFGDIGAVRVENEHHKDVFLHEKIGNLTRAAVRQK